MKKRIIRILGAAVLLLAVTALSGVIYAFLLSRPEAGNQFLIGEGKAEVQETFTEPKVLTIETENVFPKRVTVQNTGNTVQFVRVYLAFSDSTAQSKSKLVYRRTENNEVKEKVSTWADFLGALPDGWVYVPGSDSDAAILGGYFYYTKALAPGATTTALIEGIKTDYRADPNDFNLDRIDGYELIVYSESVQAMETDAQGQTYADANWRNVWKSFLTREVPAAP